MKIAVLGAGGVGSVVGGLLAHAGKEVTLIGSISTAKLWHSVKRSGSRR